MTQKLRPVSFQSAYTACNALSGIRTVKLYVSRVALINKHYSASPILLIPKKSMDQNWVNVVKWYGKVTKLVDMPWMSSFCSLQLQNLL